MGEIGFSPYLNDDVELRHRIFKFNRQQKASSKNSYFLVAAAFITARDMVRFGVTSTTTSELIGLALRHCYNREAIETIHQTLMGKSTQIPADQLAKNMSKTIVQGKNPHTLQGNPQTGKPNQTGGLPGDGKGSLNDFSRDGNRGNETGESGPGGPGTEGGTGGGGPGGGS